MAIKLIEESATFSIEVDGVRSFNSFTFDVNDTEIRINHKGFTSQISGVEADFVDINNDPFADLDTIILLLGKYANLGFNSAVGGSTANYKVYSCLLTQTDTNAPVQTVLENTLSISEIVWTRNNTGRYIGTLEGAFIENKTVFPNGMRIINSAESAQRLEVGYANVDWFNLATLIVPDNTYEDGYLLNEFIEIRVYN